MKLSDWLDKTLQGIVDSMVELIKKSSVSNTEKGFSIAGQRAIHRIVDDFLAVLYPGCHGVDQPVHGQLDMSLNVKLREIAATLADLCEQAFKYECKTEKCKRCRDCRKKGEAAVIALMEQLPEIKRLLNRDIQAAYEGDPAAKSLMEIVLSYPCLQAISVHRIAHVLYAQQVPLIPRVMSELAHSRTGIDIHPGAKIGAGFFIDHGTGVVIGETCVIGENVKIYQGVTLGALSFPKDADGNPIKGIKRHPDVGDNVTIYAGATILGGDTRVGEGAVIGGNVWLTHSVPPRATVYNQQPKPLIRVNEPAAETPAQKPDAAEKKKA